MASSVASRFSKSNFKGIRSTHKSKAGDHEISTGLEKKTAAVDEVADAYLIWLYELWDHLQTSTDYKISLKELSNIGIRHQSLMLGDKSVNPHAIQTTFFIPMDKKEAMDYRIDRKQPETADLLQTYFGDWLPSFVSDTDYYANRRNAERCCSTFEVAFGYLRRTKVGDPGSRTFQDVKGWRNVDYTEAFDYDPWNTSDFWVGSQDSKPQTIWVAKEHPHTMVTIGHKYPHDNTCLLLREIQVIISLMIVRLLDDDLTENNVIPVMILSFAGDKHGRILQAHMEGDSLVIRSSNFYDFSVKRDAHLEDFLVYMASDLQGNTQVQELPKFKTSFGL